MLPKPCEALTPARRYRRHGLLIQLLALDAVVRLGSAARAAEALCIAQPTISGHLRKLSEALGVRLFLLHGKQRVPTHAALALLQAAQETFAALDRCEVVLADLRALPTLPTRPADPWRAGAPRLG